MTDSLYSLARVSTTDFIVAFWPMVAAMIPEAVLLSHQCEETFSLGLTLFKKLAETSLEFLSLDDLVKQWGSLLLSHDCTEVCPHVPYPYVALMLSQNFGHTESVDMTVQGLTNLLYCAASFAKASQQSLSSR